ncbi:MAG: molybdopterin-dependent oxidoreductase [Mycobacterium sp.]|nr:molybdopterin-dependent oxidoreductase [Mycobacterium sp.]
MDNRWIAFGAAAVLALAAVTGCGRTDQAGTTSQTPSTSPSAQGAPTPTSNPYGVPTIDPPGPDEPILTVTGGATPLKLTMDQLNALGSTSITVDEPFVKKRQTFSGVPLAVVLAKAGIPDSATIDTVALNAYHYSSAVGPLVASNALIATKRDGAAIPYDQGGPIRMVFPDGSKLSSVLDAWNWSLASINATGPSAGGS